MDATITSMITLALVRLIAAFTFGELYRAGDGKPRLGVLTLGWLVYALSPVCYLLSSVAEIFYHFYGICAAVGTLLIAAGVFMYFVRIPRWILQGGVAALVLLPLALYIIPPLRPLALQFPPVAQSLILLSATVYGIANGDTFTRMAGASFRWLIAIAFIGLLHAVGYIALYTDQTIAFSYVLTICLSVMTALLVLQIERTASARALRESEARYRDLVEHSRDLICTHDLEGRILSANAAAENFLGYDLDTLLKMNIRDILAPEVRSEYEEYVATLQRLGFAQGQMLVRTSTGERRIWEYDNSLRTEGVAAPIVRGRAQDVTEQKQAEKEARRRSRELATLLEIGRSLAATLDTETVLQTSIDAAVDLLGLGSGAIYLLEGETLCLAATTPPLPPQFPEEYRRTPLADHPHIRQAVATGEPVVLPDAATAELSPAERAVSELRNLRSIVYVPLLSAERAVGVCILGSVGETHAFSESQLDLMHTLAAQAALAVENARLHSSVQRRARELAALYETSLEINAQRDLASLLESIVRRAADLLGAPMGGLYLMRPDNETLELAVSHNLPGDWTGTTLRLGEGVSGRVAQTREVLMIEDHRQWEGRAAVYEETSFRRVLAVPLIVGDRVVGVLDVTDTERAGLYSEDEVRLASLFADQAAIAIQNARLYEEVQSHAAELEQRVAERTAQLRERAAEIEQMNRALANLLEDLRASNLSLSETAEKLKEVNEELEAFGYSVAHDLRAPLRAMQGFARAMLEDCADQLDDTGREYAQRIVGAGQRLDGMIQDLLAYSRVARTDIELHPTPLETAVAQALSALQTEADAREAQILVEGPLPQVLAHSTTLAQVIGNLISNALKFTAPGVAPEVRVWAEERGSAARLWVQDNGIGIAPEHHKRIFRVFERLHGVEAYPGTGIGLAIVRKGVERMGGRVGVESEVGKGSRFWIEFRKEV